MNWSVMAHFYTRERQLNSNMIKAYIEFHLQLKQSFNKFGKLNVVNPSEPALYKTDWLLVALAWVKIEHHNIELKHCRGDECFWSTTWCTSWVCDGHQVGDRGAPPPCCGVRRGRWWAFHLTSSVESCVFGIDKLAKQAWKMRTQGTLKNIATGKASAAIPPFHFTGFSNFSNFYHLTTFITDNFYHWTIFIAW